MAVKQGATMHPKYAIAADSPQAAASSLNHGYRRINVIRNLTILALFLLGIAFLAKHGATTQLLAAPNLPSVGSTASSSVPDGFPDDFVMGYLEFDWPPGHVPGFGPLYPTNRAVGNGDAILAQRLE